MGTQRTPEGVDGGLCNAVIMAAPSAAFLDLWHECYRDFSDEPWAEFSVARPYRLALGNAGLIHVEPAESFFWPTWDRVGIERILKRDEVFEQAYVLHLWGKNSWPIFKDITMDSVMQIDTSYNRIARRHVLALWRAGA